MSKRQQYVEKIFEYFSSEISAKLYWKLFIFEHFTDPHKKHKSCSDVKNSIDKEYRRIKKRDSNLFFKRFNNITLAEFKKESLYFHRNDYIKSTLKYSEIEDLIKIISVSQFNRWMQKLYPSPRAMGLLAETWDADSIDRIFRFFFNTSKSADVVIPTESDPINLLLSKKDVNYLYIVNHITEYDISASIEKKDRRKSRLWDHTIFTGLFIDLAKSSCSDIDFSFAKANENLINFYGTYYDMIYDEINAQTKNTNFSQNHVAVFHIPSNMKDCFDFSSEGMMPCPLLIFHSYNELKNKNNIVPPKLITNLKQLQEIEKKMTAGKYQMKDHDDKKNVSSHMRDIFDPSN